MKSLRPASPIQYLQLLLLFMMFFLWAVGSQMLGVFAITRSPCAEAVATFGSSENMPTTFEILMWICYVCIALLIISAGLYRKSIRGLLTISFHIILLLGFIILQGVFYSLTLDKAPRPTGFLQNTPTIWSQDAAGTHHYTPSIANLARSQSHLSWRFGEASDDDKLVSTKAYCVWREDKLIAEYNPISIKAFHTLSWEQQGDQLVTEQTSVALPKPTLQDYWGYITHQYRALNFLRDQQSYRPMSPDEVRRYDERAQCIKDNWGTQNLDKMCTHRLYVKQ